MSGRLSGLLPDLLVRTRQLRRVLESVVRLLEDVRRRQADAEIYHPSTRLLRRRRVPIARRRNRRASVQHAPLSFGLRRQLERLERVRRRVRRRKSNARVFDHAERGVRWRELSIRSQPARKQKVQHSLVPGALRGQLGRVRRVRQDVRRRHAVAHLHDHAERGSRRRRVPRG